MKSFEKFLMLTCMIQCDFAYGLQMIFPEITDEFEDKPSTPARDVNSVGNYLSINDNTDIFQRRKYHLSNLLNDPESLGDEPFEDFDYDMKQLEVELRSLPLKNIDNPDIRSRSPAQLHHLSGNTVPSFRRKFYRQDGDTNFLASKIRTLIHLLVNTRDRLSDQTPFRDVRRRELPPSKRNSGLTPPSRDWCRLIGYRVCPRGMKTLI